MAVSTTATELARLIQSLQQERQQHADAIAEIDATFASLGITPKLPARRGRKPATAPTTVAPAAAAPSAAKPAGKRRRRRKAKDGMTGEQFLLSTLASAKLATAEVTRKWAESGRKGAANNILGKLVREGKINRKKGKGERGSVYSAV